MNKNWNDRADKDLFFTILSVKNIGIISGYEWTTIGNHMRSMGYGFTNEGCRQHFQGLRRAQHKADVNGVVPDSSRKSDPTMNPITRRPGPGRGRPRKQPLNPDGTTLGGPLPPPQPRHSMDPFPVGSIFPFAPVVTGSDASPGPPESLDDPHPAPSATTAPSLPGDASVKADHPATHSSISPGTPDGPPASVGRVPEDVAGPDEHPQENSFAEASGFHEASGYPSPDPPSGHDMMSASASEPAAPPPHSFAPSEQPDPTHAHSEHASLEEAPPGTVDAPSGGAHLPEGRDEDDHEHAAKRRRIEEPTETQQALDDEAVLALAAAHNETPSGDGYTSAYPHPDNDHPDALGHGPHPYGYH